MSETEALPPGSTREQGKDAQRNAIQLVQKIADLVKTTLGPKGMDKMLMDSLGDVTVTNDGATILRELQTDHPAAKLVIEVSRQQEAEVGDGTTSVVVLAGKFLGQADVLLKKGIHPTIIIKGFTNALHKALETLKEVSEEYDSKDLLNIAKTAMTGKGAETRRDALAAIVTEAVERATTPEVLKNNYKIHNLGEFREEHVRIEVGAGADTDETELLAGLLINRAIEHPSMPKGGKQMKVLILDEALQYKHLEVEAQIQITDPDQLKKFQEAEQETVTTMVNKVLESGADLIVCGKPIDQVVAHFLAEEGKMAVQRVHRDELQLLAELTGGAIATSIERIRPDKMGVAEEVSTKKVDDKEFLFIKGKEDSPVSTILVRGNTDHIAEEVKRVIEDALGDVKTVVKNKKIVCGAGATEMHLSQVLGAYALEHEGREQLVIEAYAKAFEVIPEAIAENAGLDPINSLAALKRGYQQKPGYAGLDVETGEFMDARERGVIEPLRLKTKALESATDVAIMLLRVDDVLLINKNPNAPPDAVRQGDVQ